MTRRELLALLAAATVLPAGCGSEGTPEIAFDHDACDWCRMTISDRRHAAVARTAGGRTARFDAIECLAAWTAAQADAPRVAWVTERGATAPALPVADARFLRDGGAATPMAMGWVAIAAGGAVEGVAWDDVVAQVGRDGLPHAGLPAGGTH
jgi:copper chaperone NosL